MKNGDSDAIDVTDCRRLVIQIHFTDERQQVNNYFAIPINLRRMGSKTHLTTQGVDIYHGISEKI